MSTVAYLWEVQRVLNIYVSIYVGRMNPPEQYKCV